MLLGACSEIISRFAPQVLNLAIPLCGLTVLVSAVTCIVAATCERLKRKRETTGPTDETASGTERSRAFWFLLGFFALSLLATILDRRIQQTPGIQGIGRAFGPLGAFLGTVICLFIGVRFKEVRFLILGILSLALLVFWIWRIATQS